MRDMQRMIIAVFLLVSAILGSCAEFPGSGAGAAVVPKNDAELKLRLEQLRAEYAPYMRSLPLRKNVRTRTMIDTGWAYRQELLNVGGGPELPPVPDRYKPDVDLSEWEAVTVPEWRYPPGRTHSGAGNIAWYRTTFKAEKAAGGKRLWLCFDGVDWEAHVYLNGVLIGKHRAYYEAFRFDITDTVAETNTLAVRVIDGRPFGEPTAYWAVFPDAPAQDRCYVRDKSRSIRKHRPIGPHCGTGYGIHRRVYLEETGQTLISGLFARNSDGDFATLRVETDAAEEGEVTIEVQILPENFEGRAYMSSGTFTLSQGTDTQKLQVAMPGARRWTPKTPYLYRYRVIVRRGNKVEDVRDILFGCRSFGIVNRPVRPPVYRFKPLKANRLRIVGRGSDVTDWNSIWEVTCSAFPETPVAEADGEYLDYSAAKAVDENPKTRWAVQGRDNHWIKFRLNPDVAFDAVTVNWFDYETRTYDFDLEVSDDGLTWRRLSYTETDMTGSGPRENLPNGMFLLNGKPCFLRGTNIQGLNVYWYWGETDKLIDTVLMLKAANFNCVRVCQHVQFPEVRELLDRLGMMSEQDQGSGYRHDRNGLEPHIMKSLIPLGGVMARETYNNPGVILLTFGNECHFVADEVVKSVLSFDPERIVKPISGRLSHGGSGKAMLRDESLWANVVDDTHIYAGWYGVKKPQTWEQAYPRRPRRLITIGEYGGEALDAYDTMRDHYPAHLKPPPKDADVLWAYKQVKKHDFRQIYGLGRNPQNLGEYIEASQKWQESATADQTIGFRISPRTIGGYFHFHFIDAVTAFWPKSIVSVDLKLKKTYYQMAQINQPVVPLPQFAGLRPDGMTLWVANDTCEPFDVCRLEWTIVSGGRVLLEGGQSIDIPAISAVRGQSVDLKAVTADIAVFEVYLTLKDGNDNVISRYQREVNCVPDELLKRDEDSAKN